MKIFANNIAFVFFLSLSVASCTHQPIGQATNRVHIGIGTDRLSIITREMISDMRLFFSKQIVFKSADQCPVRIMIDPQKLRNESAERINFSHIINAARDHLRNPQNAEALSLAGRAIAFVDRERRFIAGQSKFQKCKAAKPIGADYALMARIISDDKISQEDIRQRQTLISFWLVDLDSGAKAWTSKPYLFKSYGQNDVVYR